jgi:4-amino-4-deoxy-L-arabinose transferase-like glycosyltransferase
MENGLAARNGGRIGLAALVAILLLGLGLRFVEAWDGRAPVYDAAAYAAIAANLEGGEGFTVGAGATQPSSNYSPGLPLFVAGLYEATGGEHERLARVVLALIGTLSVLFAYLIGRRLGRLVDGRPPKPPDASEVGAAAVWPALMGAAVVAIYPAFLEYQGMLMSEPLAATLLSGGVLGVLWAWDEGASRGRWLLAGALFGLLALVRPEYLGVAALIALVIFLREARGDWRRSLLRAGIFLGALVLVIAPWTIRNAVALDRFVPISTGGGQVLFAGTYLPSDGDPEKVGTKVVAENSDLFQSEDAQRLRLEQILAQLAADRYPEMETDQALSKLGKEQLWDGISEEPVEYAGFVVTKVWRIWSQGPREVMQEPFWKALHWALVVLGLLGLAVLAWMRRWEALLLGTIFLAITALSALLVASPRRVLVLIPLLAALTTVSATWLASFPPHRVENSPKAPARPDSLDTP